MKKSSLTTAVVAGLAGAAGLVSVANAVHVNPDGLGQVLIYPYYTVNNGQATLISVVNTTDEVKAVKVRFLESLNSAEVLDFNLYLSPFDVWTGAILDTDGGDDGRASLVTQDRSCTVPTEIAATLANPTSTTPFQNFQYAVFEPDTGPRGLDRTREGHIEIIEMGVVESTALAAAATHNSSGVPANCPALQTAFVTGIWNPTTGDPNTLVSTPTGGLFGAGEIVNVAAGTNLSYNAVALDAFYTFAIADGATDANDDLHNFPESIDPSLSDARNGVDFAIARVFDAGTVVDLGFEFGEPDAASAALMHNEIYNEYNTLPSLNAASEWVMTFPTKRAHTYNTTTIPERRPFTQEFDFGNLDACEQVGLTFWDREERSPGEVAGPINVCPSPPPPGGCNPETPENATLLCYEANIFTFNQSDRAIAGEPSAVLAASFYTNFDTASQFDDAGFPVPGAEVFQTGWARLQFVQYDDTDGDGVLGSDGDLPAFDSHFLVDGLQDGDPEELIEGLPVVGFWVANYQNGNVGGVLANYSGLHDHRGDRNGYGVFVDPTTGEPTGRTGFAWS
ncbi:MAG TPA: hypothetical protein VFG21_07700 [Xanthomonadaceae bacterium]|nr:hypothetical protein [Xanthomonadaceae bacterium]